MMRERMPRARSVQWGRPLASRSMTTAWHQGQTRTPRVRCRPQAGQVPPFCWPLVLFIELHRIVPEPHCCDCPDSIDLKRLCKEDCCGGGMIDGGQAGTEG